MTLDFHGSHYAVNLVLFQDCICDTLWICEFVDLASLRMSCVFLPYRNCVDNIILCLALFLGSAVGLTSSRIVYSVALSLVLCVMLHFMNTAPIFLIGLFGL